MAEFIFFTLGLQKGMDNKELQEVRLYFVCVIQILIKSNWDFIAF